MTVARLRIELDGRNVSVWRRPNWTREQDHVLIPLYSIAECIAENWWRLIAHRGVCHNLKNYRSGFLFPDIGFTTDGKQVEVISRAFRNTNPSAIFWIEAVEWLEQTDFENRFAKFIDVVSQRLIDQGVRDTDLEVAWARVASSRADPNEAAFCRAAGALGIDPYTCDDEAAAEIERAAKVFTGDRLEEFLAGATTGSIAAALDWIDQVERDRSEQAVLPGVSELTKRRFEPNKWGARPTDYPWKVGYAAARWVRNQLEMDSNEPIASSRDLAKRFGNPDYRFSGRAPDGLVALVDTLEHTAKFFVGRKSDRASNLFALARGIGDSVCFRQLGRSPVTKLERTYRQRVGRAFAAELIVPAAAIREKSRQGKSVHDIAREFNVYHRVIEHQMENQIHA